MKKIFKILLIFILTFMFIKFVIAYSQPEHFEYEQQEYVVQKGDRLWTIALQYQYENQDTREYIYEMEKINDDINVIYPGQVINILVQK